MALELIFRDGTAFHLLGSQTTDALRKWWGGQALGADKAMVDQLLSDMRSAGHWLACDCCGNVPDKPILTPVKQDKTIYLRRLTHRREHARNCIFWFEQTEHDDAKMPTDNGGVAKMGSAPSFLLEPKESLKATTRKLSEPSPREGNGQTQQLTKMARRLFWLAEQAGLQHEPAQAPDIAALRVLAETLPVASGINLKQILFCHPGVWEQGWATSAFDRCEKAGVSPQCLWVQPAVGIDLSRRVMTYESAISGTFEVPVRGRIAVFGGDASRTRFPLLAIGALRRLASGEVVLDDVYAQPIACTGRWMLLDSDLERQTRADLLSVCSWLWETKQLEVAIDKPLFEWNNTGERPDFVLSIHKPGRASKCLVVETMGYEDEDYEARKSNLTLNVKCPVFMDRRQANPAASKELKSAVAKWALSNRN
ncbi:hypothetical protein LP417_33875 (plasmid) [Polaromonas sp. P1-6]|nr:hypothetical protein LP417_33875 [Polaromonas sp. P1-6]